MKKYIFRTFSFLLAVSVLTSCLKDDSLVLDPEKGHNVIEFANPAQISVIGSIYPLYTISYDLAPEVTVPVTVSYSGPESGAPEDITVNIAAGDSALVKAYNEDQDEHFTYMPASNYAFQSGSAVIKKGEKKATINITFKLGQFDLSQALVLPLQITSASSGTVSGNFNTILLNVGAKNIYEGVYKHTYTSTLGNGTNEVTLVTNGANSVYLDPGLLGVYSNAQTLLIDPATNRITVVMTSLLPIATDPSSSYDPETKTLRVKWTSNGGARTFDETYVFDRKTD